LPETRPGKHQAHEKPLLAVQEPVEDELWEIAQAVNFLTGFGAPHWGQVNASPPSPIFCSTSKQ